jgi:hypothetical protein
MTKTIKAVFVIAFACGMLLPVACQVNAASVNPTITRQSGTPMPGGGGGGHFTLRQSGTPMPGGGGGGHFTFRQSGTPMPGGGGGGH